LVHFCRSYRKNKSGPLFLRHRVDSKDVSGGFYFCHQRPSNSSITGKFIFVSTFLLHESRNICFHPSGIRGVPAVPVLVQRSSDGQMISYDMSRTGVRTLRFLNRASDILRDLKATVSSARRAPHQFTRQFILSILTLCSCCIALAAPNVASYF